MSPSAARDPHACAKNAGRAVPRSVSFPCVHAVTSTPPNPRAQVAARVSCPGGRQLSAKALAFPPSWKGRHSERPFEASMVFTCVTAWTLAGRTLHPPFVTRASVVSFRLRDRRDSYPAHATRTGAGLAPAGKGTPSWRTITGLAMRLPSPSGEGRRAAVSLAG